MNRRDFLTKAGLGAASAVAAGALAACASSPRSTTVMTTTRTATGGAAASVAAGAGRPLGVQLYTLRALMQNDFDGTLAAVAAAGYKEVEFAGYYNRTPEAVRARLAQLGLTAPASHVGPDQFRNALGATLDAAAAVGHRYVVCPWTVEAERTADGYRRLAAEFNRWGEAAKARGLRFGYHNHDFEYTTLPSGERGLDLLLAGTDPSSVAFEMDLYWTVYAGQEPTAWFGRYPGRFELWHMKDLRRSGDQRVMTDVGSGDIDFRGIYAQREQAGVRHLFVEYDNAPDPLASIRTSYAGLRRIVG